LLPSQVLPLALDSGRHEEFFQAEKHCLLVVLLRREAEEVRGLAIQLTSSWNDAVQCLNNQNHIKTII